MQTQRDTNHKRRTPPPARKQETRRSPFPGSAGHQRSDAPAAPHSLCPASRQGAEHPQGTAEHHLPPPLPGRTLGWAATGRPALSPSLAAPSLGSQQPTAGWSCFTGPRLHRRGQGYRPSHPHELSLLPASHTSAPASRWQRRPGGLAAGARAKFQNRML